MIFHGSGSELGKPRSAATAVASAPHGAGAHPDHESAAAVALNVGLRCKKRLWREHGREQLESFRLAPWASRRRQDLLGLVGRLDPTAAALGQAVGQKAG